MSEMLRLNEVSDLLETHYTVLLGEYAGSGITADEVAAKGSSILDEAFTQSGSDVVYASDLIDQAVAVAVAIIRQVNQSSDAREGHVPLKAIQEITAQASPVATELGALLRMFHNTLQAWLKLPGTGFEIAFSLGTLANGLVCDITGNNEGQSGLLPFCASVVGETLRASSRAAVCRGLGLNEKDLQSELVTNYSGVAAFLIELSTYSDSANPGVASQAARLAAEFCKNLREPRMILLGSSQAPEDWDWRSIIDAIVRSNQELLAAFVERPTTPLKLAAWCGADIGSGNNLVWNSAAVPVLAAGTAPDGSLVGLLGCLTWT